MLNTAGTQKEHLTDAGWKPTYWQSKEKHTGANEQLIIVTVASGSLFGLRCICACNFGCVYTIVTFNKVVIYLFIRLQKIRKLVEHSKLAANTPPIWSTRATEQSASVWSGGAHSCVLEEWHWRQPEGKPWDFFSLKFQDLACSC